MTETIYERAFSAAGISHDDSVLVLCGGAYDMRLCLGAGLKNVKISNVDYHADHKDYAPYSWEFQDAESLTAADKSYDWCIVHAGLHHCASPHRALCEMLRVARKGVVVVEARDSLLMRLAIRTGATGDYELEPAALSGGTFGGYRNTPIPNYVYRWTEREVEKTVCSFAPQREPRIDYLYGYRLPLQRLTMARNSVLRAAGKIAAAFVGVAQVLLPRQGNEFAFIIRLDGKLKPWLKAGGEDIAVDLAYLEKVYDAKKYKRAPANTKT
jgi:ubiquinone/menaquinone biosynthesis C-methylase UbiE